MPACVSNPWTFCRLQGSIIPTWLQRPACNFSQSSSVVTQWPGNRSANMVHLTSPERCLVDLQPCFIHARQDARSGVISQPLTVPADGCCIVSLPQKVSQFREHSRDASTMYFNTYDALRGKKEAVPSDELAIYCIPCFVFLRIEAPASARHGW
jgi:hypothetical protein